MLLKWMAPGRTPALLPTNGLYSLYLLVFALYFGRVSIYLGWLGLPPIYPVDHTPMGGRPVRETPLVPPKSNSGWVLTQETHGVTSSKTEKHWVLPGFIRENHKAPGQEGLGRLSLQDYELIRGKTSEESGHRHIPT